MPYTEPIWMVPSLIHQLPNRDGIHYTTNKLLVHVPFAPFI